MQNINWEITNEESEMINRIVKRLIELAKAYKQSWFPNELDTEMDIIATHIHNYKLDFVKLIGLDDFNFWHDMSGIINCMNRNVAKLENNFNPRCSMDEV